MSSSLPSMASSFLLLLFLLIPSLKILIPTLNLVFNGFNTLSTLISCIIFKATPCVLLSFLKALKLPADAFHNAFEQLAEAVMSILMYIIEMVLGITTSSILTVFEFLMNAIFGSYAKSGSAFGGLVEKTKTSLMEGSIMEQVREIIESVAQKIMGMVLEKASSSAGSVFDFAKEAILELFKEPGSAIGGLLGKMKASLEGGSAMEGVREIVRSFVEKMIDVGLGMVSSSAVGTFEVVKNVFGLAVESGSTVGGLLEKTKASLEVLRMEGLREIIASISKILVNTVLSYFLG